MCLGRTHGAPYRSYGYVPLRFGGTSLGEWEHNNILCVFIFQIILISDFVSFKINFLLSSCLSKDINKPTTFINIFTKLLVFESKHLFQIYTFNIKRNAKDVLYYTTILKLHHS